MTKSVADGGDVEGVFLRLIRRGKAAAEAAEDRRSPKVNPAGTAARASQVKSKSEGANKRESNVETVGGPYADVLAHLRAKGPSALDAEIRAGTVGRVDDDGG